MHSNEASHLAAATDDPLRAIPATRSTETDRQLWTRSQTRASRAPRTLSEHYFHHPKAGVECGGCGIRLGNAGKDCGKRGWGPEVEVAEVSDGGGGQHFSQRPKGFPELTPRSTGQDASEGESQSQQRGKVCAV
eukprot:3070928-Rhodomonas_salina.1